jgi:hypothetical protein
VNPRVAILAVVIVVIAALWQLTKIGKQQAAPGRFKPWYPETK